MNTKSLICSFIFSVICLSSYAQYTLTIEIANLRNSKGHVLLSLYDQDQKQVIGVKGAIENSKSIIKISDLKPTKYGFKYFHDENDNNDLETNKLGIPEEGFGFSNNASGWFGPPSFYKWIFELNDSQKVKCTPKYF